MPACESSKICSKCHCLKLLDQFRRYQKVNGFGYRSCCKSCQNTDSSEIQKSAAGKHRRRERYQRRRGEIRLKRAQYRVANAEKVRKWKHESYLRHKDKYVQKAAEWALQNPEQRFAIKREWYQKNRTTVLAKRATEYAANPEPKKAVTKLWVKNNRGRDRERKAKRRALMRNCPIGSSLEVKAFYQFVADADVIHCRWCGKSVAKGDRHVDHVIPLSRGGPHERTNLCCSCSRCNMKKHARLPHEFVGTL